MGRVCSFVRSFVVCSESYSAGHNTQTFQSNSFILARHTGTRERERGVENSPNENVGDSREGGGREREKERERERERECACACL